LWPATPFWRRTPLRLLFEGSSWSRFSGKGEGERRGRSRAGLGAPLGDMNLDSVTSKLIKKSRTSRFEMNTPNVLDTAIDLSLSLYPYIETSTIEIRIC